MRNRIVVRSNVNVDDANYLWKTVKKVFHPFFTPRRRRKETRKQKLRSNYASELH